MNAAKINVGGKVIEWSFMEGELAAVPLRSADKQQSLLSVITGSSVLGSRVVPRLPSTKKRRMPHASTREPTRTAVGDEVAVAVAVVVAVVVAVEVVDAVATRVATEIVTRRSGHPGVICHR